MHTRPHQPLRRARLLVVCAALLFPVITAWFDAGASAATPAQTPPTDAAQAPPATPGRSSWSEIDPAAIGPVRPLLVDRPELRVPATIHAPVDGPTVGTPGLVVALSATPHAAFLAAREGRVELRSFDCTTAAISEPITTIAIQRPPTVFDEGPDGASVILRAEPDTPILIYAMPSGTLRTTIDGDLAGRGDAFVLDDSSLVVVGTDGTIRRFSLTDGSHLGTVRGPAMTAFAVVRGQILGITSRDPPTPPGAPNTRSMVVVSVEAATGKETGRATLPAGPAAWSRLAPVVAFVETPAGWKAIRTLDPVTLEERSRVEITPNVSSSPLGMELSADGTRLFMTEYLTQTVLAWDTATGATLAVHGPELGGCVHADVANNGARMVAIVGPWKDGALLADAFQVFAPNPPARRATEERPTESSGSGSLPAAPR
jgi:hypothetical protein